MTVVFRADDLLQDLCALSVCRLKRMDGEDDDDDDEEEEEETQVMASGL